MSLKSKGTNRKLILFLRNSLMRLATKARFETCHMLCFVKILFIGESRSTRFFLSVLLIQDPDFPLNIAYSQLTTILLVLLSSRQLCPVCSFTLIHSLIRSTTSSSSPIPSSELYRDEATFFQASWSFRKVVLSTE